MDGVLQIQSDEPVIPESVDATQPRRQQEVIDFDLFSDDLGQPRGDRLPQGRRDPQPNRAPLPEGRLDCVDPIR